jgi:hypothetical protein
MLAALRRVEPGSGCAGGGRVGGFGVSLASVWSRVTGGPSRVASLVPAADPVPAATVEQGSRTHHAGDADMNTPADSAPARVSTRAARAQAMWS